MAQEVGRFFQELRQAFGLTPAQVAARLSTRADIVLALEEGQVRALPPWSETARIVRTYAGLAGLDPRPALPAPYTHLKLPTICQVCSTACTESLQT